MKYTQKSPVLLPLLIISLVFGCAKVEEKTEAIPIEPTVTYNISGRVVDDNATSISGAKVTYKKVKEEKDLKAKRHLSPEDMEEVKRELEREKREYVESEYMYSKELSRALKKLAAD